MPDGFVHHRFGFEDGVDIAGKPACVISQGQCRPANDEQFAAQSAFMKVLADLSQQADDLVASKYPPTAHTDTREPSSIRMP